jgi:hypothetical protein
MAIRTNNSKVRFAIIIWITINVIDFERDTISNRMFLMPSA